MNTLAERLKKAREEKGFATQQALADHLRIRQSFIGALESKGQQSSKYMPEIAHALGVDAYWLKTGIRTLVAGDQKIDDVVTLMKQTAPEGRAIVLHEARKALDAYPLATAKRA